MPSFSLPQFDGSTIDGDAWMSSVKRKCNSQGMALFIEDHNCCETYAVWSTTFCSRLLNSIVENDTLGYLATQLAGEKNSYVVWRRVTKVLQTPVMKVSRVLRLWTNLFALRCDKRDDFFAFYSSVLRTTHELQNELSVAVKDQYFVRAFLAKSISC